MDSILQITHHVSGLYYVKITRYYSDISFSFSVRQNSMPKQDGTLEAYVSSYGCDLPIA